ncbi:xanthine dehydrogenase family protein molybdopterin-binding subunit [Actinomadura syzygii]|uniref:xanthine dehydrogenase family protein molybdopterin-binding subunit n=1 Tax=Actinomadura syzygii TaxID=1427538 RepID=UPI001651D8EB|nr:xanthine dehydrogenase family protein molybdopterin-binding subunit [Actinomadura syzygii]
MTAPDLAAPDLTAPDLTAPDLEVVGRSPTRPDLAAKLTGAAEYGADLHVPGALQVKLLRSPVAHARITALDTAAARAVPGVAAVVTSADLTGFDATWGHYVRDRPILARDVVRFAGEIVAAVAAETEAAAAAGVRAIEAAYEPLPALVDVRDAVAPGAARVHETPARPGFSCPPGAVFDDDNAFFHYRIDLERAPGADPPDAVVIEKEYAFPAVYQYAMEPHAVVASADAESIDVWSSCQHPFLVREELAEVFGLPPERVRIRVPFLGGGFGSKSYAKMEPVAVAVARVAGRPVRLVNSVEDAMVTTRRHGMRCRMRTVADRDGRLLSRSADVWMDTGAYADNGPTVTMVAGMAATGPYRWDRVRVDAACVYTHLPPAGSYRGFGAAHLQWVGESQVDEVAAALGVDRLELRRRNLLRRGETVIPGCRPLDADLAADLDAVADRLGWGADLPAWRGRGVSVGVSPGGVSARSRARVELRPDGGATVLVGSQELGQGARTVHAQIAAEVLGLPLDRVDVPATDTSTTPYDRSTGASRSTTVAGLAVQRAAEKLRERIVAAAATQWDVPASELALRAGRVVRGDRSWDLADLDPGGLAGEGSAEELGGGAGPALFWEVCVAGAEVAVDPDTGRIEIRDAVTVADVGRAVNPALVERQDEGCALQAVGNALFEEMRFGADGVLRNPGLLDYRVPAIADMPQSMTCVIVENGDGPGPFGAKGCGEGVFGGLTAALVTAVADAGVSVPELPMSPDRVWRWIHAS